MNTLKSRLARHQATVGAWSTAPSPLVAEAMASCGFHWLAVDLEHAPIDLERAAMIFMAAERHKVAPLARLPNADPFLARRMLDSGAHGVIVPGVESATDLAGFLAHLTYPSQGGRRGVGLSRANLWGDRFEDYTQGFEPVVVAQIETSKGVAAAPDIAALAGVDVLFVGPYDLSADLGIAGQLNHPNLVAAADQVGKAARQHGKSLGIHQVTPDLQELQKKIDDGYEFIAYATDLIAMRAALGSPLSLFKD